MAALTEKQIHSILNSGAEASSPQLQEALGAAEVELKAALEVGSTSGLEEKALVTARLDLNDSAMLRRFLVARKLQIPATVAMLEAHAAWLEQTHPIALSEVVEIQSQPATPTLALARTLCVPRLNRDQVVEEIRKGKAYSHGVDARGNPLVFVCSRNFDPRTRDLATALRATIYMVDEALRLASEKGGQIAIFYDRTDFSASKNLDLALIKAVVSSLSANYPERLAAVYMYPAGGLASMVLRMVSPLMDPRTVSKVHLPTSETGQPFPSPSPLNLHLDLHP